MAERSTNWFYYPEIHYWIHKNALLHDNIRSAIPLILNNPSWTNEQKRKTLDDMQLYMRDSKIVWSKSLYGINKYIITPKEAKKNK